jgi:hypothetical protein
MSKHVVRDCRVAAFLAMTAKRRRLSGCAGFLVSPKALYPACGIKGLVRLCRGFERHRMELGILCQAEQDGGHAEVGHGEGGRNVDADALGTVNEAEERQERPGQRRRRRFLERSADDVEGYAAGPLLGPSN